jgi:flagellar FliJ protein
MKKFKFRLAPLLKVKSHIEKQRQKEHAASVDLVLQQRHYLESIHGECQSTAESQRSILSAPFSASRLLACSRYFLKLRKDTMTGSELLRGLEREAEKRRQALVAASRERQVYEKLEEKQRTRYFKEMERAEQKETDEIAISTLRNNSD